MEILKTIKNNIWIFFIGATLLYFDIRFFLFFLLIVIARMYDIIHTYINAMIWNQNNNKLKLRCLIRKTQVSRKDVEEVIEEAKSELSVEDFELFKKDILKDIEKI